MKSLMPLPALLAAVCMMVWLGFTGGPAISVVYSNIQIAKSLVTEPASHSDNSDMAVSLRQDGVPARTREVWKSCGNQGKQIAAYRIAAHFSAGPHVTGKFMTAGKTSTVPCRSVDYLKFGFLLI